MTPTIRHCKSDFSTPNPSLKNLVDDYLRRYKDEVEDEIYYFKNLKSLEKVIHNATLAKDARGIRHDHQRRLKERVLKEVENNLQGKFNEINNSESFPELMNIVRNAAVHGFGELAVYDASTRIGAFLDLFPDMVYLHRGTRTGAKYICNKYEITFNKKTLDRNDLPVELKQLREYDIENFMCIYKDDLKYLDD